MRQAGSLRVPRVPSGCLGVPQGASGSLRVPARFGARGAEAGRRAPPSLASGVLHRLLGVLGVFSAVLIPQSPSLELTQLQGSVPLRTYVAVKPLVAVMPHAKGTRSSRRSRIHSKFSSLAVFCGLSLCKHGWKSFQRKARGRLAEDFPCYIPMRKTQLCGSSTPRF